MDSSRGTALATVSVTLMAVTIVGCVRTTATIAGRPTAASPASTSAPAVNLMNGRYWAVTGYRDDQTPNTWVFTSCGDGCAQLEIAQGSTSDHAVARYVKNQWTVEVRTRAAIQCGDGTTGPGVAHYTWNPDTLKGRYWATSDPRVCGNPDPVETDPVPLTLTKIPAGR